MDRPKDGLKDGSTDRVPYRVACTQLKIVSLKDKIRKIEGSV